MPPDSSPNNAEKIPIEKVLDALDRLLRMFAAERYLYLALTAISFVILLLCGYQMLTGGQTSPEVMGLVFGGSGLVAASSVRISWFFNRAFSLVEKIVHGGAP